MCVILNKTKVFAFLVYTIIIFFHLLTKNVFINFFIGIWDYKITHQKSTAHHLATKKIVTVIRFCEVDNNNFVISEKK